MSLPQSLPSNHLSEGSLFDESLVVCVRDLSSVLRNVQTVVNRLDMMLNTGSTPFSGPQGTTIAPASQMEEVPDNAGESTSAAGADANGEKSWYSVTVGRNPGVFHGPSDITPNITRIPGGLTTKWETHAQAEEAFFDAMHRGLVEKVSITTVRTVLDGSDSSLYHMPS
ncbi:hypothetical protein D9613_010394 [Agrocybe pediades]|uniref:Ribonuclease H1 N-terminal domain-containing protein n=1 Tax=Agrocybe pediades TaxID=84607 RepID=A0A8H4QFU9_9AGAR|nr:hypothetical protein D9613_010394 [Agrocybe pediades]